MTGRFTYFAYGSNMLTRRLRKRTPSAVAIGAGFVEGYRLTFDKISSDGSGKCNIEPTTELGDRVYGVLFTIATDEADELDRAEGLGRGYRKSDLRTAGPTGEQYAVAYIADRTDPLLQPYDWYKQFVVLGAIEYELPASYVRWLQMTNAKPDPNAKRRAGNEALFLDG